MENVIGERAVEIGWVDSEQTIDECMEQMGKCEWNVLNSFDK